MKLILSPSYLTFMFIPSPHLRDNFSIKHDGSHILALLYIKFGCLGIFFFHWKLAVCISLYLTCLAQHCILFLTHETHGTSPFTFSTVFHYIIISFINLFLMCFWVVSRFLATRNNATFVFESWPTNHIYICNCWVIIMCIFNLTR